MECSGGSGREKGERRKKEKREGYMCGGEKKKEIWMKKKVKK